VDELGRVVIPVRVYLGSGCKTDVGSTCGSKREMDIFDF